MIHRFRSLPFQSPDGLSRSLAGVLLALFLSGFTPREALFAPSAELWPQWTAENPANKAEIDTKAWDRLLKTYVKPAEGGLTLFNYAQVTPADRAILAAFLTEMGRLPIGGYRRAEQLAYWINVYNALTVKVVLDHYPVASIRDIDISPGLFSNGPWDKKLFTVEGQTLSLNDIEHRILRPIWKDPRIHYAVNCAAYGCPALWPEAYRGAEIEAQLDAAARAFVNDPRGLEVQDGKITVSKIYDWYFGDFGGTTESLLAHLSSYAEPPLAAKIMEIGDIAETRYDWRLNGFAAETR